VTNLGDGSPDSGRSASDLWRQAVARSDRSGHADAGAGAETEVAEQAQSGAPSGEWEPEEIWISEPIEEAPRRPMLRSESPRQRDLATGREGVAAPGGHRRNVPRPVVDELSSSAGPLRGAKLANRIADASYAYERERFQEARRILRVLVDETPGSASVRELNGLVLYRTGQWSAAAKELERFRELSGSYDQHPVLADCYRAMKRYDDAEALWQDLREASPNGDIVAEGRIVAAGCRADQGDLAAAIGMLEKALRRVNHPQERHLRQWYALADLYERAGDLPRARDLFNRVASADPESFDVRARLRALR